MSRKKIYSNFDEIDKDLKILHLRSEIAKEELKLSFYETKEDLMPSKIVRGILGGESTTSLLLKLLTPVFTFAISKFLNRYR